MTQEHEKVREALEALTLTLSLLRPVMRLPSQENWDALEKAHNKGCAALASG